MRGVQWNYARQSVGSPTEKYRITRDPRPLNFNEHERIEQYVASAPPSMTNNTVTKVRLQKRRDGGLTCHRTCCQ